MAFLALQSESSRRLQAFLILAAGTSAVPLLFFVNPARSGLFPPCPFRWATGWLCPGCGSLRAVHLLLHGDLAGAFALNPLMILLLPLLLLLLKRHFFLVLFGEAEQPLPARTVWILLLITLAYAVARNLPAWPALSAG